MQTGTTYWPPEKSDKPEEPKTLLSELKRRRENKAKFLEGMKAAEQELADLDRAIAALTPIRSDESGSESVQSDALAEFMKREGAVRHDGVRYPLPYGADVEFIRRNGVECRTNAPETFAWKWSEYASTPGDIFAYRVLPSEPAASEEGKGEDDTPVYGDDLAYGDGNDARIGNMPIECNPYEGKEAEYWDNGWNDADAIIKLNQPVPLNTFEEPEARAGYADDQALTQSNEAIAQTAAEVDEPAQQVATLDDLDAAGITDPGASAMARMLTGADDLPPHLETEPGFNPWTPISYSTTRLTLKRDTEFMCSDGRIRQRRVDGEVGYLEVDVETYSGGVLGFARKMDYRFTHMREWKPQLEWAVYRGMTPPTHFGYRLETRIGADLQNEYRYIPTDQFVAHQPDEIQFADMSSEELDEALGSVGLALQREKEPT